MKTTKDITHLNYNDISFYWGIPITKAKEIVADKLDIKNTTKTGRPAVKTTDKVPRELLDTKIRSNSDLDGENVIDVLTAYFNNGVVVSAMQSYGENKEFIKKLRFTGRFEILNLILNPAQYRELQKIWLFSNCYNRLYYSNEAEEFIRKHKWAEDYLKTRGLTLKTRITNDDPESTK